MRYRTGLSLLSRKRLVGLFLLLVVLLLLALGIFFFFPRQPPSGPPPPPVTGVRCGDNGVTKQPNGTYSFSWLHVSEGNIVDSNGCVVYLRGFNVGGTEWGDGTVSGGISKQIVANFNQQFKMNLWRLSLNAYWWNHNLFVPNANMNYQDWIKEIISWMEQNGNYVELNAVTFFHYPPCGGSVTHCAPQAPDQSGMSETAEELSKGYPNTYAVQMWQSIAHLYANDPAVLYNDWNEMWGITSQQWSQSQNQLIDTIRQQNPRSLIFFGDNSFNGSIDILMNGSAPPLTQPNLVFDWHIYYGGAWDSWANISTQQTAWAKSHNYALAFGEWGGLTSPSSYYNALLSFSQKNDVVATQYQMWDAMNGQGQLTAEGKLIQAAYASYPSARSPSRTPSPTSHQSAFFALEEMRRQPGLSAVPVK